MPEREICVLVIGCDRMRQGWGCTWHLTRRRFVDVLNYVNLVYALHGINITKQFKRQQTKDNNNNNNNEKSHDNVRIRNAKYIGVYIKRPTRRFRLTLKSSLLGLKTKNVWLLSCIALIVIVVFFIVLFVYSAWLLRFHSSLDFS